MSRKSLVPIELPANPTQPLEAATKQYVDSAVSGGGDFPGYGAVIGEQSFGIPTDSGSATTVSRSDHTHGTPATPQPSLTGTMMMWPLTAPPAGYLVCDGTTYLDSTYPTLAALLKSEPGNLYYVDATHFKVPDMAGRYPVGVNPTTTGTISKTVGYTESDPVDGRESRARHIHSHTTTATSGIGRATDATTTGSAVRLYGGTDQHTHTIANGGLNATTNLNIHAMYTLSFCIKT